MTKQFWQKMVKSWQKVGKKLAKSWPKVGQKLAKSWQKAGKQKAICTQNKAIYIYIYIYDMFCVAIKDMLAAAALLPN
jgi:hypothetical protein